MPKNPFQALHLPLVLKLMLASKKINELQARILDFPHICEVLSQHRITIEQIEKFNYQQIHTLENWLSKQNWTSQKYLKKIPAFNELLEKLSHPHWVQAMCFPSLYEMYVVGILRDQHFIQMTENHCITLIRKPELLNVIQTCTQSFAYFLQASSDDLKNIQMMSTSEIQKKLFLHVTKGLPKDLSIPEADIESFPDLFKAGIISPHASFTYKELKIISAWFGYCRTLDFELLIKNLNFFKKFACFSYSFTYLLLFKDVFYPCNEEALKEFCDFFETQDNILYEHWNSAYETLYFPLMNARVFTFKEYLAFSDERKQALVNLMKNSELFHKIIQHEEPISILNELEIFSVSPKTLTDASNIYHALSIFVYDLLLQHFNPQTQEIIVQLVLSLFRNHPAFMDKDFDTIKHDILENTTNIDTIALLFHRTMIKSLLENKEYVASYFFQFLITMIKAMEREEPIPMNSELSLICENQKIMTTLLERLAQFKAFGNPDIKILLSNIHEYWFNEDGFETLFQSINLPLIDANKITWIHLPILMGLLTKKLQFNLQIYPIDVYHLSQQHDLVYPSCTIFHELSSNQWRYHGFFINECSEVKDNLVEITYQGK